MSNVLTLEKVVERILIDAIPRCQGHTMLGCFKNLDKANNSVLKVYEARNNELQARSVVAVQ